MRAVKHEDIPVHSSDSEESIFTIEDVSSVQSQGKQLYANMKFQDIETEFRKDLSCQVNVIKESSPLLRRGEILSKYKDVFEGLGHIGDASFSVDPESTVQHAPRRVPVTLHTEVNSLSTSDILTILRLNCL